MAMAAAGVREVQFEAPATAPPHNPNNKERQMASAAAVANRRANRRLRNQGKHRRDPIAVQMALEHNRTCRAATGLGVHLQSRIDRLHFVYERWADVEIAKQVRRGQLRFIAFSFELWLCQERAGWTAHQIADLYGIPLGEPANDVRVEATIDRIFKWWLAQHPIRMLELLGTFSPMGRRMRRR